MKDQGLTLFVSKGEENGEAIRILRIAGLNISVVPHPPGIVEPELQIGANYNRRVRGLPEIREWLSKQPFKSGA